MNPSRRRFNAAAAALLAGTAIGRPAHALDGALDGPLDDLKEGGEDLWLALEAYAFLYPLVTMALTAQHITNVAKPDGTRAPFGNLIKLREYPNASFRDVTAPNADTLYTTAFLDVGDEPWLVQLPDFDGRYALFPMLDA